MFHGFFSLRRPLSFFVVTFFQARGFFSVLFSDVFFPDLSGEGGIFLSIEMFLFGQGEK